MTPKEKINQKDLYDRLVYRLVYRLVTGLVFGLVTGLVVVLVTGLVVGLAVGLVTQIIAYLTSNPLFSPFDFWMLLALIIIIESIGRYFVYKLKEEKK